MHGHALRDAGPDHVPNCRPPQVVEARRSPMILQRVDFGDAQAGGVAASRLSASVRSEIAGLPSGVAYPEEKPQGRGGSRRPHWHRT